MGQLDPPGQLAPWARGLLYEWGHSRLPRMGQCPAGDIYKTIGLQYLKVNDMEDKEKGHFRLEETKET